VAPPVNNLLIHVHGFLSAGNAGRVVALKKYIDEEGLDIEVISPQLPNHPQLAISFLEKIISDERRRGRSIALIGHSLGGYFSTYLASKHQLKAVLVNPVVRGYEIMCEFFGECFNPHSGDNFEVSESDIEYLINIHLDKLPDPDLFLVMQQMGDEITDPNEVLKYYRQCRVIAEEGGCHDFSNFEKHVQLVIQFLFNPPE